jgi:hypothetical protein
VGEPPGFFRSVVVLAVLALACGKKEEDTAGIQKDDRGCWLDGDQAWMALSELGCSPACLTDGTEWTDEDYQYCMEVRRETADDVRDRSCFDGCGMDACLAAVEEYHETCSATAYELVGDLCSWGEDTPFYGPDHPVRTCIVDKMGW